MWELLNTYNLQLPVRNNAFQQQQNSGELLGLEATPELAVFAAVSMLTNAGSVAHNLGLCLTLELICLNEEKKALHVKRML